MNLSASLARAISKNSAVNRHLSRCAVPNAARSPNAVSPVSLSRAVPHSKALVPAVLVAAVVPAPAAGINQKEGAERRFLFGAVVNITYIIRPKIEPS